MFDKEGNSLGFCFGPRFQLKLISNIIRVTYCVKVEQILLMFQPMNDIKFEAKNDILQISNGSLRLQVPVAVAKFSDLIKLLTDIS